MRRLRVLILLVVVAGASLVQAQPGLAQEIYFDPSDPTTLVVGNSFYEIGLQTANGAIAYIADKRTGQRVSEGSRYGCLWGAFGSQTGYIGGCSYAAGRTSGFSYAWSAADSRLTLRYTPDPASIRHTIAQVTLTVSPEPWFDLQLQLENQMGGTIDYVLFPSDLVFREADIQSVYLPVMPGIRLQPAFFAQNRSYVAAYPGELFADLMALEAQSGSLAIYAIHDGVTRPLVMGLNHDDGYLAESSYYYHSFGARAPDGALWTSPRVRVRVAQPVAETIEAYRTDNGLDRFASLAAKAGPRYEQLARSPLIKADATHLGLPFAQYAGLLAQVPPPGLLHLLAFQPGGFDENHPDMLPPAPAWGGTAEMAAMMRQAQALGFLVMPYTNPTWWDEESPTLSALIAAGALSEVAATDQPTVPRYEVYGTHGGYVVSPYAAPVRQRLAALMASVKESIPGDLVFEDQVGARAWLFDHHPAAPGPTAYADGWLEHTRTYSQALLMTEGGTDRLAETELGFHASVLLAERLGQTIGRWGEGTWRPYPLAPLMLRDKVLFYQHNLAPETFTNDTATLAWNLAFGYMLSYDLGRTNYGGGTADPWLAVVADFQQRVLAGYAGERMLRYEALGDSATLSAFERFAVVTNWNRDAAYAYGAYVLPPSGVMVASADGSLTAGVFTVYNDAPLAGGEHFLIEQRGADSVVVRQPMGGETPVTIRPLATWQGASPPQIWAYSAAGERIGSLPGALTPAGLTFTYRLNLSGRAVAEYRISAPARIYLPMVARPG